MRWLVHERRSHRAQNAAANRKMYGWATTMLVSGCAHDIAVTCAPQ